MEETVEYPEKTTADSGWEETVEYPEKTTAGSGRSRKKPLNRRLKEIEQNRVLTHVTNIVQWIVSQAS